MKAVAMMTPEPKNLAVLWRAGQRWKMTEKGDGLEYGEREMDQS
jgi:hypothetical protein